MRLNKYIASSGYCSRRKADELISNNKVYVNGKCISNLSTQVQAGTDVVTINGEQINVETQKVYVALNKPRGYITTSAEQFDRKCIMDLIHEKVRLFPVGRLDMDTEGIIILTNDGDFANELIHPKNNIYKTYIVKTDFDLNDIEIQKLSSGVDIGGYVTKPAIVKRIKRNLTEVKICEGKNRQIRRMFEAINKKVIKLKRIAIGNMKVDGIEVGQYKKYSLQEIKSRIYK